jgi:hypothetical protein
MPSGRGLGILISACQNYETATHLLRANGGSGTCFLTVIKVKGVHMSNLKLYKEVINYLKRCNRLEEQRPGLYCDDTQKSLKFLSLEESNEMDDEPVDPEQPGAGPMDID